MAELLAVLINNETQCFMHLILAVCIRIDTFDDAQYYILTNNGNYVLK